MLDKKESPKITPQGDEIDDNGPACDGCGYGIPVDKVKVDDHENVLHEHCEY